MPNQKEKRKKRMTKANMSALAERLGSLRDQKRRLERKISSVQGDLLREMELRDAVALEIGDYRISYVAPERVIYHVDQLKNIVDTKLFRKVTNVVVDSKKLEEAVLAGEIPMEVVTECSEVKPTSPYIKIGTVSEEEDE